MWISFPCNYLKVHGKVDGRQLGSTDYNNRNETRPARGQLISSLLASYTITTGAVDPARWLRGNPRGRPCRLLDPPSHLVRRKISSPAVFVVSRSLIIALSCGHGMQRFERNGYAIDLGSSRPVHRLSGRLISGHLVSGCHVSVRLVLVIASLSILSLTISTLRRIHRLASGCSDDGRSQFALALGEVAHCEVGCFFGDAERGLVPATE